MNPIFLSYFFALGIFAQGVVALMVGGGVKKFLALTGGSLALSAVGLLALLPLEQRVFTAVVIFSLCFCTGLTYFFKAGIIRAVNERYMLFINIVFIYFLSSTSGKITVDLLTFYIFVASLFTFVNAFTKLALTRIKKIFMYVWLIFMTTGMIFRDIFEWARTDAALHPELFTPLAVFLKGMSSCLLVAYALYLIFFLAIGHTDFESIAGISKKHPTLKNIIEKRFSDEQISRFEAVMIIVITGGALALNHHFKFVHYQIVVDVLIIVLPFIAQRKTNTSR